MPTDLIIADEPEYGYWKSLDALSDQFFTDSAAVRAMFPSEVQ